jgi:hypothetical protein
VEGRWLWAGLVVGAGAGAVAFGLDKNWTGFGLCAAATIVALTQLVRILLRKRVAGGSGDGTGGGKPRW